MGPAVDLRCRAAEQSRGPGGLAAGDAAAVPVLAHAPMARHQGELKNGTFEIGARLAAAGIPFAYQSGHEGYVPTTRVVLLEAARPVREVARTARAAPTMLRPSE